MIKVEVNLNKAGMIIGYKVSGHAGYAEEGQDIICSAISAVTQAPLLGFEGHLHIKPSVEINQKDGVLKVALNNEPNDMTEAILQTMKLACESIARQCPEYVHILEHRR